MGLLSVHGNQARILSRSTVWKRIRRMQVTRAYTVRYSSSSRNASDFFSRTRMRALYERHPAISACVISVTTAAVVFANMRKNSPMNILEQNTVAAFSESEKQLNEKLASDLIASESKGNFNWKKTLEKVVPAIVSLKLNNPKWFDTESPGNGSATGFIVDAERGIILTNRHVVGSGPIDAEAVFQNNEEVRVRSIYRDPVHDFGFFQFDPKDVKHISVLPLPLRPDNAAIGVDIRVVGNDAAEKLAIASGTLARLDRDSPVYGPNKYNDFNTFYYQASSGTTGGSSGSPVLNQMGEAIALNAGGKVGTSASFYLPLDRVQRALKLIQQGKPVTRGTIHTVFRYKPFDEIRRLGVCTDTEDVIRSTFPLEVGMLIVSEVLPNTDANKILQPGDILVRVNGQPITQFVPLEAILDDNVGNSVEIEVERAGTLVRSTIHVDDLHAVTPSRFIEIGGAVINSLSYQQARNHARKPGAPYVADAGYFLQRAGIGRGAVIHSVNGIETSDLDSLRDILVKCEDGERIIIKYSQVASKADKMEVVHVDRRWFPFCEYTCDDTLGTWNCTTYDSPSTAPDQPKSGIAEHPVAPKEIVHGTRVLPGKNAIEARLAHSLVSVDFDRPFSANSLSTSNFRGTGLVIDAEKGLVVVDRNTVADSIGDATITFASTIKVPVHVLFVHPVHNFAILQYDPKLFGSTSIKSCKTDSRKLHLSEPVWLVGLQSSSGYASHSELVSRETIVSGVRGIGLPLPSPPRYQEHNLEMVALQDVVGTEGGAVCDLEGHVKAFWASFSFQQRRGSSRVESQFTRGIPMDIIMKSVASLADGKLPELWDLGVDFEHISLARARELGLDQNLSEALEKDEPHRRTALSVARRWGGTDASKKLQNGDIVVAVDDKIVTSFTEVERCSQKPQVTLTVVRNGKPIDVDIKPVYLEKTEVHRLVFWQGLLLQAPPLSVSAQRGISSEDGIYVSCRYSGSPAARYGPPPTTRIQEINGQNVKTLNDFVKIVRETEGHESVRIKYIDLNGKERLSTLKLEPKYWPTSELVYENGAWHRRKL